MNRNAKIYIAGHTGLAGSALFRYLIKDGFNNVIFKDHNELDLTNQKSTLSFFETEKPEYVFLAAAKVGGILANNTYKAEFIYTNIQIQTNVIHASYLTSVKKLLFLGSSCIYPKNVKLPIKEESLLTGEFESTNAPYALAKTLGVKMCEYYFQQYACNFITLMPCNLFGPNDNYNFESSHVFAALIRKIFLAKCLENNDWKLIHKDLAKHSASEIENIISNEDIIDFLSKQGIRKNDNEVVLTLWGNGEPCREFLHSDDLAEICVNIMKTVDAKQLFEKYNLLHINVGTGKSLKIKELAEIIKKIAGFHGCFSYNNNNLNGFYDRELSLDKLNDIANYKPFALSKRIGDVFMEYKNSYEL